MSDTSRRVIAVLLFAAAFGAVGYLLGRITGASQEPLGGHLVGFAAAALGAVGLREWLASNRTDDVLKEKLKAIDESTAVDARCKEKVSVILKDRTDHTHLTFAWPLSCLVPITSLIIIFFWAEASAREKRLENFPTFAAVLNPMLKRVDGKPYSVDDLSPSAYRHVVLIHLRCVEAGVLPGDYDRVMSALAKELNLKVAQGSDLKDIDVDLTVYMDNLPSQAPPGGRQNLGGASRD